MLFVRFCCLLFVSVGHLLRLSSGGHGGLRFVVRSLLRVACCLVLSVKGLSFVVCGLLLGSC